MAEGGGITGLMTLFADIDSLEVPDFQRNYSWGEDQIDEFYNDVVFATKTEGEHFMGSIILMQSSPLVRRSFQVIDGQQRLTTIFMFVALVRDKLLSLPAHEIPPRGSMTSTIDVPSKANSMLFSNEETGTARFKSNVLLRDFLYEYVFKEPATRAQMPRSHKPYSLELRKAYHRLSLRIDQDLIGRGDDEAKLRYLWELLKTVQQRLKILRITTSSYAESFDIFMTLNSRGLALGPSDLVKSLFMKVHSAGSTEAEATERNAQVLSVWKDITDNIGDGDVDQFLRHFLVARQTEAIQAKGIYRKIEELIDGDSDTNWKMLKELERKSFYYGQLLRPETIEDPAIMENVQLLQPLLHSYRILMMTVLDETVGLDAIQRRELSTLCEILCVRWVLIGGNAQELEDHLQIVSNLLGADELDYSHLKSALLSKLPHETSVKAAFQQEISKTALVRAVLGKINRIVGDPSGVLSNSSKKVHVEHIAPVSMTSEWKLALFPDTTGDISAEYGAVVEQWGNKTLLDKKINESVGAKPFRMKCQGLGNWGGYIDSPFAITKELARHFESWDKELIKDRNDWICDSFLNIWSLQPSINEVLPFHEWVRVQSD